MAPRSQSVRQELFENSPLPMLVLEQPGLRIVAANRRAEAAYGASGGLVGTDSARLWRDADRDGLESMLAEAAGTGRRLGPWTHSDETSHDSEVGVYTSVVDFVGAPALLLVFVDLTDDRARERALADGVIRDALTGVLNTSRLMDCLRSMVSRAANDPDYRFAVLWLDLDGFRHVNERLGHISADAVLAGVATRLLSAVHADDAVARVGGDEFVVLSDRDAAGNGPRQLVERVLAIFGEPFVGGGEAIPLSASAGLVVGGGGTPVSAESIIQNADAAMHLAKQRGRGHYEVFDEGLQLEAQRHARTEADLRRALTRAEFVLYYQPVVTISDGVMNGAEALLRWTHPEDGLLAPGAFISVAEDSGLIVPLGDWVIHEACRQVRSWHDAGLPEVSVSVNVSARQFRDGDVCRSLRDAISDAGINGSRITTEITESIVMEDPVASAEIMSEIGSLGVRVAMDDFGTGYSSLSYLKRFHFDSLKIDRSFIAGIDRNVGDAAIVAAVIALAHSFRSHAVGEGVESPEQLRYLRLLNCDTAQGFLFSRPIPADDLAEIMRRGTPWSGLS